MNRRIENKRTNQLKLLSCQKYAGGRYFILMNRYPFSPQCAAVIWHGLASSRRRASTSALQTTSVCMVRAAIAVTALSQERWSLLLAAHTIPSASSAACAGIQKVTQKSHLFLFTWRPKRLFSAFSFFCNLQQNIAWSMLFPVGILCMPTLWTKRKYGMIPLFNIMSTM